MGIETTEFTIDKYTPDMPVFTRGNSGGRAVMSLLVERSQHGIERAVLEVDRTTGIERIRLSPNELVAMRDLFEAIA